MEFITHFYLNAIKIISETICLLWKCNCSVFCEIETICLLWKCNCVCLLWKCNTQRLLISSFVKMQLNIGVARAESHAPPNFYHIYYYLRALRGGILNKMLLLA